MKATITTLTSFNFHEVVTLVWETINAGGGVGYKRAEAEEYVKNNAEKIVVLEIDDAVFGMYGYYENPHSYTLSFFALDKRIRKKKVGYTLYKDMTKRLRGKPIIIPVYNDNDQIVPLVKKRGKFIGRFKSLGDKLLDYYAVDFGDKEIQL